MYRDIAHLLLYSDLGEDSILLSLADIVRDWDEENCGKDVLIRRTYAQIKRILDLSTIRGIEDNQ